MNQMHGLKDHIKVNILAETNYSETFQIEQNKSAKLLSFTVFQKTKSSLQNQIQTLANTKMVLEPMRKIIHTPESVSPNSTKKFLWA